MCVHVCMCICMYVHTCAYVYVCVCVHMHVCVCMCVCMCVGQRTTSDVVTQVASTLFGDRVSQSGAHGLG